MNDRLYTFIGGGSGQWQVLETRGIVGQAMPEVPFLSITTDTGMPTANGPEWVLRGIISNERYVHREEKDLLIQKQEGIGREKATMAVLIPIRKNPRWWAMTQDERRAVFEDKSHHIQIGLHYLPAIARRLHHCRDISPDEPFDFLTWFEFEPKYRGQFDDLLFELRKTEEWKYVERETEIRLAKL